MPAEQSKLDAASPPSYSSTVPELAEVEFYRKQWNPGLGGKIRAVALHSGKRIFAAATPARSKIPPRRDAPKIRSTRQADALPFFQTALARRPSRHDRDFARGTIRLPARQTRSPRPAPARARTGLQRSAPVRAAPVSSRLGGSRMVGETSARTHLGLVHRRRDGEIFTATPPAPAQGRAAASGRFPRHRQLDGRRNSLAHQTSPAHARRGNLGGKIAGTVARGPFRLPGGVQDHWARFSDPPRGWFIHERWNAKGRCPRHGEPLPRATIGGRTTAWCPKCQPEPVSRPRQS